MADTDAVAALTSGNRRALAKAITLVESRKPDDRVRANDLIEAILPHCGNSIRIGISGVPGVGKSTFIEAFGLHLLNQDKKVAVLAVDPSSPVGGGSILGDKTRMPELSRAEGSFIRPSPSSGIMGGIAQRTRETMLLCEAAGYDVILVETVGVGQSEVEVHGMVDFFMMLMVPNAGDDLQGIKRGITELVDAIVINKADGPSLALARDAQRYYMSALKLMRTKEDWRPRVLTCSAIEKTNLPDITNMIGDYFEHLGATGLRRKRRQQNRGWMLRLVTLEMESRLRTDPRLTTMVPRLEAALDTDQITPLRGAEEIISTLFTDEPGEAGT